MTCAAVCFVGSMTRGDVEDAFSYPFDNTATTVCNLCRSAIYPMCSKWVLDNEFVEHESALFCSMRISGGRFCCMAKIGGLCCGWLGVLREDTVCLG